MIRYTLSALAILISTTLFAQGTWQTLTNTAPDANGGVMILLTDGTVMVLTETGPNGYGNTWDLLTPDSRGSYLNGTWTQLPPMHDGRLYCATEVLPDGNVYVSGGEYGDGDSTAELYNTVTKTWTYITGTPNNWHMYDGNSELLENGKVLQGVQVSNSYQSSDNLLYTESLGSYDSTTPCFGSHDEASWVKLPDNSIMNVDILSKNSERYIQSTGLWVHDASLPNYIYDFTLGETGPDFLLPNGKLFFLSDTTYGAIYTPSGSSSPGTWVQGPAMPSPAGVKLGCPDAPAAMLPTGNILCTFSPAQTYNGPEYFYEYNYLTNTFTPTTIPGGGTGDTISGLPAYGTCMLNLPDGTILFCDQGDNQYYQYIPSGSPIAAGKPVIDYIQSICPNFLIHGKQFTGISEGSCYGDDWQMATNYPIVRLTNGSNVYYAKTTNWNHVGSVMTGSAEDTAYFTIPSGMPAGTYSVQVIANGIASDPYNLTLPCTPSGINELSGGNTVTIYPNPSKGVFNLQIANSQQLMSNSRIEVYNMLGENVVPSFVIRSSQFAIDLSTQPNGIYLYRISTLEGALIGSGRLVINK